MSESKNPGIAIVVSCCSKLADNRYGSVIVTAKITGKRISGQDRTPVNIHDSAGNKLVLQ
jgi:hypothetical protein